MQLSIVATLYHSAEFIDEFVKRAGESAGNLYTDFEIILVNDGSPDDSLTRAVSLTTDHDNIIVIDLSRNFGHHKAMMTGLSYTTGDRVFLIDSDLEEEPEWLTGFSRQMDEDQCDVVYGVQKSRKGSFFEQISGRLFYLVFRFITGFVLPDNIVTARLMTRRYVKALLSHEEREVFMAGLWYITGFDQRPQFVNKHNFNKTTYTFRKKMSVLVNSVTSFSNVPLIAIFYIGIAILIFAGIYITYLVIHWLFLANPPGGWTSVMASVWLLGGMIISLIGIVGIYLSKIFSETKHRPYTIVRQVYGKKPD